MVIDVELTEIDRARFAHFLKRDEKSGCLLWGGGKFKKGYGILHKNIALFPSPVVN